MEKNFPYKKSERLYAQDSQVQIYKKFLDNELLDHAHLFLYGFLVLHIVANQSTDYVQTLHLFCGTTYRYMILHSSVVYFFLHSKPVMRSEYEVNINVRTGVYIPSIWSTMTHRHVF